MGKISLSNIAEELAMRNGIAREAADNFMRAFVETIEKGLQEDGMVKVKGLGTFKLQEVSDRGSVDVNTGERITIKGYRKVTFTPDSAMKELVNRPFAHFEPTELNDGYPTEEELIASDDVADDNEGVEVVEKLVETIEEETAVAVETPQEEEAEDVEKTPIVETVESEQVVKDAVEDVGEEDTEQPFPEKEEASVIELDSEREETPGQEEVPIQEEDPKQEPKKRRGCGCWVALLLLLAFATILAFTFGWLTLAEVDEVQDEEVYEEYSDIVVKPNLEEELGAEWGDGPKVEPQPVVDNRKVAVGSPTSSDVVLTEPVLGVSAKPAEGSASVTSASEASFFALTPDKLLFSKDLKDVTLQDTTDYEIDGTLVNHKLKSGETIIQLAYKYYGDKRLWPYIVKHNRIKNYNSVAIGQSINIPVLKN